MYRNDLVVLIGRQRHGRSERCGWSKIKGFDDDDAIIGRPYAGLVVQFPYSVCPLSMCLHYEVVVKSAVLLSYLAQLAAFKLIIIVLYFLCD